MRQLPDRLPSTVPAKAGEPAHGLAARLARRSGADSLQEFCLDVGLNFRRLLRGQCTAELAGLAGIEQSILEAATVVVGHDRVARLGGQMLIRGWAPHRVKVCPECLAADVASGDGPPEYRAFLRSWWNIGMVDACPHHGRALLGHQPSSGAALNWHALDVRFLGGAVDLAGLPPDASAVMDARPEAYLLGRLGFMPREELYVADGVETGHVLHFLGLVGKTVLGTAPHRELLIAGYETCAGGERAFATVLDHLESPQRIGVEDEKFLVGALRSVAGLERYSEMADRVQKALHPGTAGLRHPSLPPPSAADVVSLGWFARARALNPRQLLKVLTQLGYRRTAGTMWVRTDRLFVSLEALQKAAAVLERLVDVHGASRRLGLARQTVLRLVTTGVLESVRIGGPLFAAEELDALLARIPPDLADLAQAPIGCLDLKAAAREAAVFPDTIVAAVVNGSVTPVGRLSGTQGFGALVVRTADIGPRTGGRGQVRTRQQ